MRTSGIFTTHAITHKLTSIDPFNIYFFSDVHKGALLHDAEKWNRFLEIAKADTTALFVGGGDYTEIGSTKERKALGALKQEAHESLWDAINRILDGQCADFSQDIEFMRGRLIGLIGGNHDAELKSGIWASQKIADNLGTKWLGVCSLIKINIEYSGKRMPITIYMHHGKGGGSAGNAINKVSDLQKSAEADIYVMSDSHTRTMDASVRMYLGKPEADGTVRKVDRDKVYIRSGSFLRGYDDGSASYVTDMALSPASIGAVRVRVRPIRTQETTGDVTRHFYRCELIPEFV